MIKHKILSIDHINGKPNPVDYSYRKTEFESDEELEKYRKYLETKIEKPFYLTIKHFR